MKFTTRFFWVLDLFVAEFELDYHFLFQSALLLNVSLFGSRNKQILFCPTPPHHMEGLIYKQQKELYNNRTIAAEEKKLT